MHNAPPVVYPVGRFVWGARLSWLLAVLSAVALLAWRELSQNKGFLEIMALMCWLISVTTAMVLAKRDFLSEGQLLWDGQGWHWQDLQRHEHPVHVHVLLDTGHSLFVVCQGLNAPVRAPLRRQFALLHRATMPLSWHGFRCAVYSRPMGDARPELRRASPLKI